MNKKLLTFAVISALTLSACGGSDDEGSKQPTPQSNNQQTNNSQTNNENTQNPTADAPFTMQRHVAVWKHKPSLTSLADMQPTYANNTGFGGDGNNFQTIEVDGVKFSLIPDANDDGLTPDEIAQIKATRHIELEEDEGHDVIIAHNLDNRGTSYAHYGWLVDFKTQELKLFYQGKPTANSEIPTTGNATYKGYSLAINPDKFSQGITNESLEGGELYGLSQFDVDFANKTVKGKLNDWQSESGAKLGNVRDVNIDAKIQANTFLGTANSNGYVEGSFYGSNAQNLAGAFEDKSQDLHGVFGANKQ